MQKPTGTIYFMLCSIWIESRNLLTDFEIEESFRALQHLLRHFSPDDLIFTKELSWALRVEWVTGDPLPVEWSGPQENLPVEWPVGMTLPVDWATGRTSQVEWAAGETLAEAWAAGETLPEEWAKRETLPVEWATGEIL